MNQSTIDKLSPAALESRFAAFADKPGAVWLDSSLRFGDRGRYSFLARRPVRDVSLESDRLVIREPDRSDRYLSGVDLLDALNDLWTNDRLFSVGYFGYEAMTPLVGVAPLLSPAIPSARFLFYDNALRYDHDTGTCEPVFADREAPIWRELDQLDAPDTEPCPLGVRASLSRSDYLDRVRDVKDHIREGDIYQANFTSRLEVENREDSFDAYRRLRRLSPAPYSAYLNFGAYQVLSSSPERMFLRNGGRITTGPIKGTIARGETPRESERNLASLTSSEKDRAELLMIVDLERNDLGKIASVGSVCVDALFKPEIYSSVIHLVSDISATLKPGATMKDICAAMLPGGSITGAPKQRAVEILRELETVPRSVYTGAIGYVCGDRADFNIAIRTMIAHDNAYHIHAGGGIVADSDPGNEYEEMLLKARNMLAALGVNRKDIVS